MVRSRRFAATSVVVIAVAGASPSSGQPVVGLTLQPLGDADSADLYTRVPGCRAAVVDAAVARPLAVVAQAAWVMLRTSRGVLELPVVFRDRGDKAPELRFSVTDAALGGSMRGTLSQAGEGRRCPRSAGCMEIPAQLTVTLRAGSPEAQTIFDGAVTVVDHCATDASKRVFMTVSWWERVLRLISGH